MKIKVQNDENGHREWVLYLTESEMVLHTITSLYLITKIPVNLLIAAIAIRYDDQPSTARPHFDSLITKINERDRVTGESLREINRLGVKIEDLG